MTGLDPTIAGRLRRNADGLVCAVVQQRDTGEVLMVAWMDDEALHRTLCTRRATYWPRSAHSTASMPVPRRPPWVVTSKPEDVGAEPSGTRRASTDSTMHCAPKRRLASRSSSDARPRRC